MQRFLSRRINRLAPLYLRRQGVLLFGVLLIVAILGMAVLLGMPTQSTQARRERETDLQFKLSELRRGLDLMREDGLLEDGFIHPEMTPEEVAEKVLEMKDLGYLRKDYSVPLLDFQNAAWRVSENLLSSSSFESSGLKIYTVLDEEAQNIANFYDWWFSASTSSVEILPDYLTPPVEDYPGQTSPEGNPGKMGSSVIKMRVPGP